MSEDVRDLFCLKNEEDSRKALELVEAYVREGKLAEIFAGSRELLARARFHVLAQIEGSGRTSELFREKASAFFERHLQKLSLEGSLAVFLFSGALPEDLVSLLLALHPDAVVLIFADAGDPGAGLANNTLFGQSVPGVLTIGRARVYWFPRLTTTLSDDTLRKEASDALKHVAQRAHGRRATPTAG